MKNKDFIEYLKTFDENAEVIISSDEELNELYSNPVVSYYGESTDLISKIIIYPDSLSLKDDDYYNEDKSEYKKEILEKLKIK